jgi:hypothetical protein
MLRLKFKVKQGGFVGICFQDNASAVSAVSAVRSAFGHKLFPTEGNAAVSAVAGL